MVGFAGHLFVLELNQRYVDVLIPMDREELEAGEFVVIGD